MADRRGVKINQSGAAAQFATSAAMNKVNSAFDSEEEALRKQRRVQKQWTIGVVTVVSASMVTALVAMYIEASAIAYIAFVFPLILGPYNIRLRRKLNRMPTFRHVINKFRMQVNRLAVLNMQLHAENNRLQGEVSRLQGCEKELEKIATNMGTDTKHLHELIRENGETVRQMKQLQEAREVQNFLTAILQSDTNRDQVISEQELNQLMLRLKAFSNNPIKQQKLQEAFSLSGTKQQSTTSLFHMAQRVVYEDEQEDILAVSFGYALCTD